jgi:dynein heavy chain
MNFALPPSMWLSGLFHPAAFLTAVRQVTARATSIPLESLTIETHVVNTMSITSSSSMQSTSTKGVCVHGVFIEGARWYVPTNPKELVAHSYRMDDLETVCAGYLTDPIPRELLSPMPILYVRPVPVQDAWELTSGVGYFHREATMMYECPVYITTRRGPTYVCLATLRTKDPQVKWILAGVAMVLQAD